MSDKTEAETDRVRISQVLAGALAAVTAAVLGSTMGVAGTIVGAGLASVVSTLGGALYLRSIKRTTEGVRTVRAKVVGKSGGATVLVSSGDPEDPAPSPGEEVEAKPEDESEDRPPAQRKKLRWPMLIVASLAAFALGMLVVTGVEWLRGESLAGDKGTTFSSIIDRDGGDQRQETPAEPSTTTPTAPTTGSAPPTSTTTSPTTTSTTPPSDSSTTTTTTPPVTTTVDAETPGGSIPPALGGE